MLHYTEFCLSPYEVPGEQSICIYISGCIHKCPNCHYPELQLPDNGELLYKYFSDILALYLKQASCICFLGEGMELPQEKNEFALYTEYAHNKGLKSCLYSGRDTVIEQWMHMFDYIKLGSYHEEFGTLDSVITNQRMYRKNNNNGYDDVTYLFWDR